MEALIESLLPVLDGFDARWRLFQLETNERKGFELIERQLENMLSKKGLEQIDAEGKQFDPNLHHAVEQVNTRIILTAPWSESCSRDTCFTGGFCGRRWCEWRRLRRSNRAGELDLSGVEMVIGFFKMCGGYPASRRV